MLVYYTAPTNKNKSAMVAVCKYHGMGEFEILDTYCLSFHVIS